MDSRVISSARFPHVRPLLSPSFFRYLTSRTGATDATYHVMWVIVFDAVDDFGIKEMNDITRNHNHDLGPPQTPSHIDEVKVRVFDEALRGASRIAGLVCFHTLAPLPHLIFRLDRCFGIAPIFGKSCPRITRETSCQTPRTEQRLDPAAMLPPCLHSGFLLARLGRPEVLSCISGLRQYSFAYEEAADQASEMNRIYNAGGEDLSHMASVGIHARMVSLSPTTSVSVMTNSSTNGTGGGAYL